MHRGAEEGHRGFHSSMVCSGNMSALFSGISSLGRKYPGCQEPSREGLPCGARLRAPPHDRPRQPGSWVSGGPRTGLPGPGGWRLACFPAAALLWGCHASTPRGNRPPPRGPRPRSYRPLACGEGAVSRGQRERGGQEPCISSQAGRICLAASLPK